MSASKDKVARQQLKDAGLDKRALAKAKEEKERRASTRKYTIVAVVLVLFFAFIFIYNSSLPAKLTTAVTVNGEKYSAAELNYYYSNAYQTYYQNYYYYFYLGYGPFDTDTPLDEQEYADGQTWHDYFLESAVDTLTQVQMLNEAAEAAGFVLSDEERTEYDESVAEFETAWEDYGYSSLKQFVALVYGDGVTPELVETEMYRMTVASAYAQQVYDDFEYTAEELAAYYEENAASYNEIEYAYCALENVTSDDEDETADTEAEDLVALAEAAVAELNGTDFATFETYAAELLGGTAYETSSTADYLSTLYSEWLLDESRVAGDVAYFEEEDGCVDIVMYLGLNTNDYKLASFRHLLVQAVDADEDGAYSDDEVAAAEELANTYYAEWQAGAADEDSFAELANTYSEDTGSNTTGGLYEDVYQGQMVTPINDWLFEDGRAAGDTAVLTYNEGGSYTGTHVVYYVGQSDMTYADSLADSALREEDYSAWSEEQLAGYEAVTSHLGLCGDNY